jgi:hypothetical protein
MYTYLREVRHSPKLRCPSLSGQDSLLSLLLTRDAVPVIVSILKELRHHRGVQSIGDVEEELPVTLSTLTILGREMLGHSLELEELVVEVLDGDLVVPWGGDVPHVLGLDQLLPAGEDIFEHILGAHIERHHVVLNRKVNQRAVNLPGGAS